MNLKDLFPKVMGFIVIIVTLALAPTINTANATIVAANLTNLTGMSAVSAFGAPLIILGLLFSGGLFAVAGAKGQLAGASMKDMLSVIGSVVIIIVALSLFGGTTSVISYTNTLIAASSGFAVTVYGIIPLLIYIGIIAAAGYTQARVYRKYRRNRRSRATTANY